MNPKNNSVHPKVAAKLQELEIRVCDAQNEAQQAHYDATRVENRMNMLGMLCLCALYFAVGYYYAKRLSA